jgi:hypothetical protein
MVLLRCLTTFSYLTSCHAPQSIISDVILLPGYTCIQATHVSDVSTPGPARLTHLTLLLTLPGPLSPPPPLHPPRHSHRPEPAAGLARAALHPAHQPGRTAAAAAGATVRGRGTG